MHTKRQDDDCHKAFQMGVCARRAFKLETAREVQGVWRLVAGSRGADPVVEGSVADLSGACHPEHSRKCFATPETVRETTETLLVHKTP